MGKSALVERLAQDLPDARYVWGACDGLFPPRPLGPLSSAPGRTNAEIARHLFLCVKAVDHHVSAVLGKLGAATRRDAVARASELGLGTG